MEQRELVDGFVTDILTPARDMKREYRLGVDQANISFIHIGRHLPDLELVAGDTIMQEAAGSKPTSRWP
jgi:hypothetical protein